MSKVLSFQVFVRTCRRPCLLPEDYMIKHLVKCDCKEKKKVTHKNHTETQALQANNKGVNGKKQTLSVIVLDRLLKTPGTGLERITYIF